ncbi:hypothetical protein [Gordonia crocea]|uniref:Uncharacterized protein n=1 Tax=Gordonia crocea TaxID=589162 RepID=A0A7M3SV55_9ACTN|nr:hypothetical protein [Gordonia crocea]GED96529.1 hypothetical protein nbrc107697_05680 [Gordonia crocea]
MTTPTPTTRRARGAVAGVVCSGAAVLAHVSAGASLPSSGSLILLAGFGATVGVLAARASGRLPGLIAGLLVGQFFGHLLLAATAGHSTAWTPTMAVHHTAAAVAVGLSLWLGERLVALIGSTADALVGPTAVPVAADPDDQPRGWPTPTGLAQFLLGTRLPTRGPPALPAH